MFKAIAEVLKAMGISWQDLLRVVIIAAGTYGLILILGRLLKILKTINQKNFAAAGLLFILSWCIVFVKFPRDRLRDTIWDTFIYGSLAGIFYIGVCWKLVDRVDSWLDRKGLKDKKKYK